MKPKDLFVIILKVIGIYLIKDVLLAIPPVISEVFQIFQVSKDVAFFSFIFSLFVLGLHLVIVYLLLFKTGYLISKLKLTTELSDEPLQNNMHRSSIYTIAIIVSGILILTFSLPSLVNHIYFWYEYVDSRKGINHSQKFDFSGLLTASTEVIIGFLFLGNQRTIVNFIELKRREAST